MGAPYALRLDDVLKAIPGSAGIVTTIADRLGCAWNTARDFIDRNPEARVVYDAECEKVIDLAETQLIRAMRDGDGPMIKFYLTTKGKKRGYTERIELEHMFKDVPDDDLRAVIQEAAGVLGSGDNGGATPGTEALGG